MSAGKHCIIQANSPPCQHFVAFLRLDRFACSALCETQPANVAGKLRRAVRWSDIEDSDESPDDFRYAKT